jgi:hypothetical protein
MTADSHLVSADDTFSLFIERCHQALAQQANGHPEPFLEL